MKVLVPNAPAMWRELEPLPDGVELVTHPAHDIELVLLGPGLDKDLPVLFAALPHLRMVQTFSAGVDRIERHVPPGVILCSAAGVHDISVSQWVVAALLGMQRRLPEYVDLQRRAAWSREVGLPVGTGLGRSTDEMDEIDDLDGALVLILGHGSIGRAVAARLEPFGMRVTGIARRTREGVETSAALPHLVPQADVVVDLLPLTPQTDRFVGAELLARMKPQALFINAGRGRTVDTDALLTALTDGRIRAALDVTDPEPLPADHPLWRAPNVLITPHIAGSVTRWEARAYRFAGEQIRRYVSGGPLLGVQSRPHPVVG